MINKETLTTIRRPILNRLKAAVRTAAVLIAAVFVVLSASACTTGEEPPVTFVVITDTPDSAAVSASVSVNSAAQVTSAPTLTPPPQPTATPDIPPDVQIRIGSQSLLNGFYEQAIMAYQDVRTDENAAAEQRAAAAFGQGQAALREGLFSQAVEALTFLITSYPDDTRVPQAYFLRGDAYMGLSRWTEAINDFNQYLRLRPGIIDSYVHERIGDAFLAIEFYDQALESYALATGESRTLAPGLALREKVAQVYISAGDIPAAVAQYDAILTAAQNTAYRAGIELRAAQALIDAGDLQAGLTRMQRIFENYSAQPEAFTALNVLLANEVSVNKLLEGRVRYNNEDYAGAAAALNEYSTQALLSEIPAEFHLLLGRAYRGAGNSPAAQVAFQTVVSQYPTSNLVGEALLEQGRTRFLAGDIPDAINFYLNIANDYTYLSEAAADALWRAGYLYSTQGQYAQSREVFTRLADTFPQSEFTPSGLGIAAAAALNTGDTGAAETLFARLAELASGDTQAEAYLQVGRLALQRGDNETAQNAFRQAVGSSPDSYFAARAADIAAGVAPFTPPASYRFEFDEAADISAAEAWLRATFGIEQEGRLWVLSPELDADPRMVRGRELWTVGAFTEAETEFFALLEANKDNPLASYQLSLYFRGIGSYLPSMQGAANIITTAGIGTLDAPDFIARLRYPIYYRTVILDVSQRREFDPLLLASLIRHESLFNTNAVGGAGEHGLTQVIPSTGEYIAGQIGWTQNGEPYNHGDLFRPYAGIEFGAYFLDENLERFNGNVYAALAGYNAGPGRAAQWLEASGGDPDLFMNTITIDSTRQYVQLIYKNHSIYKRLYGG